MIFFKTLNSICIIRTTANKLIETNLIIRNLSVVTSVNKIRYLNHHFYHFYHHHHQTHLPIRKLNSVFYSHSKIQRNNLHTAIKTTTLTANNTNNKSTAKFINTSTTVDKNNNNNNNNNNNMFRISDYDCVGFDLDNTLLRYKISAMVELEYNSLVKYMVEEKNYSGKYLKLPMSKNIDLLQRGLIIDFKCGNILKINSDGEILRGTHGTHPLTDEQLEEIYGPNKRWNVLFEFVKDLLCAWNGPEAERMRTLLDYFDMPAALVFARCVDTLDEENGGKPLEVGKYNIWPDLSHGLLNIYTRDHFETEKSPYFQELKLNPGKYIHVTSEKLISFLKELKKQKTTFLVTGSHLDLINLTASYSLGPQWMDLFDSVICFAKKPGFFNQKRKFIQLDGTQETVPVENVTDLQLNTVYCQGNFDDLLKLFATKNNGIPVDKVLYFGDNIIQDVFAPNKFTICDTIAISEEMFTEGIPDWDNHNSTECHKMLESNIWGSYFGDRNCITLWTDVIRKYSKLCIPTVDVLADNPIDHAYKSFTQEHNCINGFYPKEPKTLRQNEDDNN